ncbi:MAG TPA: hypothetical protein VFZ61_23065 [Polyangiales bacterium]
MNHGTSHWIKTWRKALLAESGRQWMYDGTAREVADAKGWKVVDTHNTEDMVLVETAPGKLLAIGALPRAYGFWSVDIPSA